MPTRSSSTSSPSSNAAKLVRIRGEGGEDVVVAKDVRDFVAFVESYDKGASLLRQGRLLRVRDGTRATVVNQSGDDFSGMRVVQVMILDEPHEGEKVYTYSTALDQDFQRVQ